MPSSAPQKISDSELNYFLALDRELRVDLAKEYAKEKNVLQWGKMLFPEKFYLPFCYKLHDHMVNTRMDEFTDTEAPRNHAKTLIRGFLIPLFQALNEPEAFQHYLNVQSTNAKAIAINSSIRVELERNDEVKEIYGDQVGTDRWSDHQFVLKNETIFTAVSAGQSIRGINYRNIRPDWILVDDLYDEDDINNPDSTEKKTAWFWGSLYPARAKSRRCSIHVQGTAINNEDILESLKKNPDVKSMTFKAVEDWDKKTVLWPELNTFESLEKDREKMGSVIFMRELQNERRDESTAIVKRSWLQNWEYDPIELRRELKEGRTRCLIGVIVGNDPSIGKDSEADDTGTVLVYKTGWFDAREGNEFWIDWLEGNKLTLVERIEQLKFLYRRQAPGEAITAVEIEAIGAFDDYASEVIRKTNLPVHRVEWVRDKISNLESKSHFFENAKVHLNKNIDPKVKEKLIHQLTTNHPKHDDLRDAVLLTLDDTSGLWGFVS